MNKPKGKSMEVSRLVYSFIAFSVNSRAKVNRISLKVNSLRDFDFNFFRNLPKMQKSGNPHSCRSMTEIILVETKSLLCSPSHYLELNG